MAALLQTASEAKIRERFRRLSEEWKDRSRFLSNSAQMAMLKPYQRIIGMGFPAVPLILEELNASPTSGSGLSKPSPKRIPSDRTRRERSARWPGPGLNGASRMV